MKKQVVLWAFPVLVGMAGPLFGAELAENLTESPKLHWAKRIDISGAVEVDANSQNNGVGETLTVSTAMLNLDTRINNWSSAHISLLHEGDAEHPIVVDEASVTIGNPDHTPVYVTAGRMVLPFGNFSTQLLSDPLTLELAETAETALLIGFQRDGWTGSGYLFNGDSKVIGDGNSLDQFGLSLGYEITTDAMSIEMGLGYINSMEDSDGITTALALDANTANGADIANMSDTIGGVGVHANVTVGPYSLNAEYITALNRFDKRRGELSNTYDARPRAWNTEIGYTFNMLNRETTVALGYQGSREAVGIGPNAMDRYIGGASVEIDKNTTLGVEYFHDKGYADKDKDTDSATVRLAVSF